MNSFSLYFNFNFRKVFVIGFKKYNKEIFVCRVRIAEGLNPIQDGPFQGCTLMMGGGKGGRAKICHTYLIMMKLGSCTLAKEDPKKYMTHVIHTLNSADISTFYRKSANVAISKNTDIDCILVHSL